LKLDESCISNSKSEIGDCTVQFRISDFEFEMQDSSNFKFFFSVLRETAARCTVLVP